MAYEKQNWANGDVITADKLNHMEGGIEESIGYTYSENEYTEFDETTVTTTHESEYATYCEGEIPYESGIETDLIRAIFDGKKYDLIRRKLPSSTTTIYGYGSVDGDFSVIPFGITSRIENGVWYSTLMTADEGTHRVKVSGLYVNVNYVTPSFSLAAWKAVSPEIGVQIYPVNFEWDSGEVVLRTPSYEEVLAAHNNAGRILVGYLAGATGVLVGFEDVYGTKNFIFNFMKADVDSTTVQFTTVKLKSDGSVSHSVKQITLT